MQICTLPQTDNHASTPPLSFLQAGCPSCCPTNGIIALKAKRHNKDVSLIVRGTLYCNCVQSSMLHGSETWPITKENEVSLQRAEMRMVRLMCGVKLQDTVPSKGLRERLGLDDIVLVLQQNRLRWYGYCAVKIKQ